MPGTVNQRASPRYLPKTNVGFVRETSLLFLILPLDKSHFITEVRIMEENAKMYKEHITEEVRQINNLWVLRQIWLWIQNIQR